jgi:hypothetical protein
MRLFHLKRLKVCGSKHSNFHYKNKQPRLSIRSLSCLILSSTSLQITPQISKLTYAFHQKEAELAKAVEEQSMGGVLSGVETAALQAQVRA